MDQTGVAGKHGRLREVAVVGRWPFVEVRLYIFKKFMLISQTLLLYQ